jgi:hypothetical protein
MALRPLFFKTAPRLLKRYIAIPSEHGSWVFLFSPLIIGFFAGGVWKLDSLLLLVSSLAGFMLRQPVTILVKILSGRRHRSELPAAIFWISLYALAAGITFSILAFRGYGLLAYLAIPAFVTLAWHLWLVSRRSERHRPGVEIIASGTLALSAPAAYWIGMGEITATGWWLWGLCWLQAASSIVYAYLRLEQRDWKTIPGLVEKIRAASRPLIYTTFSLVMVLSAGIFNFLPKWLFLAYGVQWIETLWGSTHPAVGVKPTSIGIRQLIVSVLFTLMFIILW